MTGKGVRNLFEAFGRVKEAGLAVRPQHFKIVPEWTIGCGREVMKAILSATPSPT